MKGFSFLFIGALLAVVAGGCAPTDPTAHKFSVIIGGDEPALLQEDVKPSGGSLTTRPTAPAIQPVSHAIVEPLPRAEDMTLTRTAERSLVLMGGAGVPELRRALFDSRMNVRIRAASMLADIGPDAKEAAPDLVRCMQDPNPELQKAAIRALGSIGPAASGVAPELVRLLENDA